MIYENKNGYQVAREGWVIISGVEHFVRNGFVACNDSLNCKAWNVTEKKNVCPDCAKYRKVKQLTLF